MGAPQRPKPRAPRVWGTRPGRWDHPNFWRAHHNSPVSALQRQYRKVAMAARLPRCPGWLGRPQGARSARSRRAALGVTLRPELFRDPESEFARSVTFPLRRHVSPTAFLLGRLSRPRAVRPRSLAPSPARCLARSLAPSLPPILADLRPQRRPRGFSGGQYLGAVECPSDLCSCSRGDPRQSCSPPPDWTFRTASAPARHPSHSPTARNPGGGIAREGASAR